LRNLEAANKQGATEEILMATRLCNYAKFIPMAFAVSIFVGCAATSTPNYDAVLTNMSRPEAERAIDPVRKPQEVMAFL
jgi:hypothetical protein